MDSMNVSLICRICGHPVTIASCTVDEQGSAVHEECHAEELLTRAARSLVLPPKNEREGMDSLAFGRTLLDA